MTMGKVLKERGVCYKVRCGPCHYCDADRTRHQHDHAPMPKRVGGTAVVVACMGCHHLKDRMMFDSWPLTLAVLSTQELVSLDTYPVDAIAARDWPPVWESMSSHARILWAKVATLLLVSDAVI